MTTYNFKTAQRRFLKIFAPVMIFYVLLCFAGPLVLVTMDNPPKSIIAMISILTGGPIGVVFWLMGRYLNETDEYTRKIQIDAMLVAGGITFSTATTWAFLELYRVVPNLEYFPSMMMVAPLFFGAWGITYAVQALKRK